MKKKYILSLPTTDFQIKESIYGVDIPNFTKKISFKNKIVLDYGCGNIETTVSTKQFFEENGNLNNFYGYETDKLSKDILLKKKKFYDFYEDDSLKDKLDYIVANQVYEHLDREERINFVKGVTNY